MCKKSNKDNKNNVSILDAWSDSWSSSNYEGECTDKGNSVDSSTDELFQKKYKEAYSKTEQRAKKNKILNFFFKIVFIALLTIYSGALCLVGSRLIQSKTALNSVLFPVILMALGGIGVILAVLKVLDVFRFQETWARHRWMKELLDLEMIRFVEKIPPYSVTIKENVRKMLFRKRVLEIQQNDIEKFASNLESKEQRLGEGLSFPKLWGIKE